MNKTEEFIETVKKFEVLYDLKRLDYKDAVARNAAWQEISKIVNVPGKVNFILYNVTYNCSMSVHL